MLTPSVQQTASTRTGFTRKLAGFLVTLATVVSLQLLALTGRGLDDPSLILLLVVLLTTVIGGAQAGILGAVICISYYLHTLYELAQPSPTGRTFHVVELVVTATLAGLMIEILRQRSAARAEMQHSRRREQQFRVAQELSPDAFMILSAVRGDHGEVVDFRIEYANPAAAQILRRSPAMLAQQSLLDLLPGLKGEAGLFQRYVQTVVEGVPQDIEVPYNADGLRGWFRSMAVRLGDGIALHLSDVTQRKYTEAALRESNRRLRTVLESITDAFYSLDRDWRLTYINAQAEQYFGCPKEQMLGRTIWEMRPHLLGTELERHYHNAAATGQAAHFEMRTPDNRWLDVHTYPSPDGLSVYFRDITHRKQAADYLEALNENLERLVAERTAVAERRATQLRRMARELTEAEQRERKRLAEVLHDHLQQLLVGAKFHTSIARNRVEDPAVLAPLGQVQDLLNQSIQMSRSLTVELNPPILYEGGLAAALHWLAQWTQETYGLRVEIEADEKADPRSDEVAVLLFQSVRELLFNVIRYAQVDRAQLRMERREPDRVRISVQDDGVGFDAATLEGEDAAAGFGLFSIRQRLDLLGGAMELDTGAGRGTRVCLEAPLELPGKPLPRRSTRQASHRRAPARDLVLSTGTRRIRVVLADDHQIVRDGLGRLLRLEPDFEVVGEAEDGETAVRLASEVCPDVVLMDVAMPQLDGIEATRRILAQRPGTRVIGLSMHPQIGIGQRMQDAGAVAYLPKGMDADRLIEAIRMHAQPEPPSKPAPADGPPPAEASKPT